VYPGEVVSGDAWLATGTDHVQRIAVIDGLGHGPDAAAAAHAAVATLTAEPDLPLDVALQHCHVALRSTRGAAISMAHIDLHAGRLTFGGVGNVEGRLIQEGRTSQLTAQRGIVGATLPHLRLVELPLMESWRLLLHSDGVTTRFHSEEIPDAAWIDVQRLAEEIIGRWGRELDDATVVAARSGAIG
jgi:hypothetical protein